jgi:hypothetical protein
MALPAARVPRSPSDRGAILETAYAQARRIAFGRWLGQIDQSEIEALVGAAVLRLLDGEAEVIDAPQTVKYLTTFVDWRAKDQLRVEQRHRAAPLPADEAQAPESVQEALADPDPTPEEAIDSAHVRDLVADIRKRIPNPVNRLIVHLFYCEDRSCPQIAETLRRVCGVELTAKAVELRKAQALKAMVVEWKRAWRGEHCRELTTSTGETGRDALTRYALDLFDRDDEAEARLRDLVVAHLKHCPHCRAELAARRRELRRAALLAVPILVGPPDDGAGTAEHAIAHAPGVFERALDAVRSGLSRGTVRAAETLPNNGASTSEMVGSAGAGGGAALGGGLAAKVLIAGTTAVCAFGGQQLCVQLLGSHPSPKPQHAHTVALRPSFPHSRGPTPAVRAAQVQPRAGGTAAQQLAHRARVAAVHRAQRRAAARTASTSSSSSSPSATSSSAPSASAASSSSSRDPTFSPTAPTSSSSSSGGGGGSGGSSGGSGSSSSSSDSTFQGLP